MISRMYDHLPMSKSQYLSVLHCIRSGESIGGDVWWWYLRNDPENADWLFQDLGQLFKFYMKKHVIPRNGGIVWYRSDGRAATPLTMEQFDLKLDQLFSDRAACTTLNPVFETGYCVSCADVDYHPMFSFDYHLRGMAGFFGRSPGAIMAINEYLGTADRTPNRDGIYGICRNCHKRCNGCGTYVNFVLPNAMDMKERMTSGECMECAVGNITKLPMPKPNRAEFRLYHGKLVTIKGVK